MKYSRLYPLFSSAAMIVMLSPVAMAKNSHKHGHRAQSASMVPVGSVLIEEARYIDLKSLAADLMTESETAFNQGNFGESADDLLAASRVYRLSAIENGSSDTGQDLQMSADRLVRVSEEIRRGEVKDLQQVRSEFGRAMYYRADADRKNAVKAWANRQVQRAGHDMTASIDELEKAAKWSGRMGEKAQASTLAGAREVGTKLIKGGKWTAADVKRSMADLSRDFAKNEGLTNVPESRDTTSGSTTPAGSELEKQSETSPSK